MGGFLFGGAEGSRFAFCQGQNKGSAPSSRRRQQSTGLLHLDLFDSPTLILPNKKATLAGGFLFGGAEGSRFAFSPLEKIMVLLGRALASNSPQDCCI